MTENQSNVPEPDMDPPEAAADIGVTEATLSTWRCLGKGPSFWKFGRRIRYSSAVNAVWKAAQRREPISAKLRREQAATVRRS